MRVALVNIATSLVEHVLMARPDHAAEGYRVVPSETANRGDAHDPVEGAFVSPATAQPAVPADQLRAALYRKRDQVLAAARIFRVAVAGSAPVDVLCDATDATMIDLGALWRVGVVNAASPVAWDDNEGARTMITGGHCLLLEGMVAAWRDEVRAIVVAAAAAISAGAIAKVEDIESLAWPKADR